jgi:hypothetical protein
MFRPCLVSAPVTIQTIYNADEKEDQDYQEEEEEEEDEDELATGNTPQTCKHQRIVMVMFSTRYHIWA